MRCLPSLVLLFAGFVTGCGVEGRDDAPDGEPAIQPGFVSGAGSALATDDDYLYVAGSVVGRVPLAGGEVELLYTVPAAATDFAAVQAIYPAGTDLLLVIGSFNGSSGLQTRELVKVPKAGGTAVTLARSTDIRAFIGVAVEGTDVYYSTFTAIYRISLVGGSSEFVAESPESTRYWIFSPTIINTSIVWAEDKRLFQIEKGDRDHEGTLLADLDGVGRIIGVDDRLVVALSPTTANQTGPTAYVEVDPTTGAASSTVQLGRQASSMISTANAVWAATDEGLFRLPRTGGAPVQVTDEATYLLTTSADAVFAMTSTGVTRVPL